MKETENSKIIEKEIIRLIGLKSNDNWKSIRNEEKFDLIERNYSFGKRICYISKKDESQNYEDLQSSRNIGISENSTIESILNQIDESLDLKESDFVRIDELLKISRLGSTRFNLSKLEGQGFVELGYRIPKIPNFFKNQFSMKAWGYDIVPISLLAAKKLNFDGRRYDFSACDKDLDLSGAKLVVSYHMLEHVSDPLIAIKKIHDSMNSDSFFHVEIPIEPGMPRLQFAHLFPFHSNDMYQMLTEAGFDVMTFSEKTHTNGPHIERYLAIKR